MTPQRLDPVRAARRMALIEQMKKASRRAERHRQVISPRRAVS